jgi:trigger factor
MRSTVEPLEGNKVKLSIELDEQEFDKAVDAAFRKIAREVRIPGFRPGKAPRRLLEARLGSGVAREEALREALPTYYAQAVREQDIDVIAAPEIDITSGEEDGPVAFDAVVEVRPRVSVAGYQGLRVTIPSPTATDDDVAGRLDRLRDQFAELVEVQRAAHDGDHALIDIKAYRHEETIQGLTADDYLYEVGSGGILPEVDEQLRGARAGDILKFNAEHPDPDEDDLTFQILVKEVKEKILPDVTDEWANEASEFDTVEELRADIREKVGAIKRGQAAMLLRQRAAEALADLVDEDPPEPLVASEVESRIQDIAMRVQAQGMTVEQFLEASGQDPEQFVAGLREQAGQSVKIDLALRALADVEEIEVGDDDLDREFERLAEAVGQPVAKVRKRFERGEQVAAVRSNLRKTKALEWLVEHVELVDDDGQTVDRGDLELVTQQPDHQTEEPTDEPSGDDQREAVASGESPEESAE